MKEELEAALSEIREFHELDGAIAFPEDALPRALEILSQCDLVPSRPKGRVDKMAAQKPVPEWAVRWLFEHYLKSVRRSWELRRDLREAEFQLALSKGWKPQKLATFRRSLNKDRNERIKERLQ